MNDWRKIIKDALKQQGRRQEDLVNVLGVKDRSSVTNMLNNNSGISWEKMLAVSAFLKLDLNYIAGRTNQVAEPQPTYTLQPDQYPLLDWPTLPQQLKSPTHNGKHYGCPVKCSPKTFVLNVVSPEMEPNYPIGHLIWVDPKRKPKPNDTIVLQTSPSAPAIHRLYQPLSTGEVFTSITNPSLKHQLDTTRLEADSQILGTVIFSGASA